jgi:hypothetical protein
MTKRELPERQEETRACAFSAPVFHTGMRRHARILRGRWRGGSADALPRVQPASASQIVDTEYGKIVSGYLEAYSAEGVSTTTVKFVRSSGWKIVGYVEAARMFQIDTGETTLPASRPRETRPSPAATSEAMSIT